MAGNVPVMILVLAPGDRATLRSNSDGWVVAHTPDGHLEPTARYDEWVHALPASTPIDDDWCRHGGGPRIRGGLVHLHATDDDTITVTFAAGDDTVEVVVPGEIEFVYPGALT